MSEIIRVGCVSYLNTRPLIEGLDSHQGLELVPMVPAKLIGSLERRETDLALVSVFDATRASQPLSILPVGMIGSDGPTLTVRLFSAKPLESITQVHADTDSHTSIELCRVLLRQRFGREIEVVDYDARERIPIARQADDVGTDERATAAEWPDALLLIGDKVVTDSPPAVRYPHQLDLGEAWHELTGLPFVYAAWMCLNERAGERAIQVAGAILDRQRRHNTTRLDQIATDRARDHRWPADLARNYLGNLLRFDLNERATQGLDRFFDLVSAHKNAAPIKPSMLDIGTALSESVVRSATTAGASDSAQRDHRE